MQIEKIQSLIIEALQEVLRDKGIADMTTGPGFKLFGTGCSIDSLDLVGIIVHIEREIFETTGSTIEVIDETSVVSDDSPFRTVASLAELVKGKLDAA